MGLLQACISKADARDLLSDGASIPEAPRLIVDVLGTLERLHFHLQARGEFEKVGRKPFGGGGSHSRHRLDEFRPLFLDRSLASVARLRFFDATRIN